MSHSTPAKTGFAPDFGDMNKEDFRRFGHEFVDWIVDYFEKIEDLPVLAAIEPGDLKAKLPTAPPQHGESMDQVLADLDRLIVPALTHWSHPSFFAYFATSTSAPGIFGELLAAAFDNKAMLWRTSPASTELEEVTLDWLRQMMGLDPGMIGIIYDTASVSSMHAIAAAREGVEQRIREEGMSGRTDLPPDPQAEEWPAGHLAQARGPVAWRRMIRTRRSRSESAGPGSSPRKAPRGSPMHWRVATGRGPSGAIGSPTTFGTSPTSPPISA